jgi:hypothetical protein
MRHTLSPDTLPVTTLAMTGPVAAPGHRRWLSVLGVMLLLALMLFAAACASDERTAELDRGEIEELLADYLPKLGEAYRTGNVEVLRDVASEKELAAMTKQIGDLMSQEGRVIDPKLVSFTVEQINVWNYSNAFVTTIEVWDLKVLVSGSEQVLSEVQDQRSRVKYQLKRRDEGWQILSRIRETTFE